jgi:hypothetical protein
VRTTKLRAVGGRFEPHRHLFVRTRSGTGGVPGSTVWIIDERLGKSSMRSAPLLSGCRLLHRRTNQGMPEPEAIGSEGAESRCYGRRPAIRADCSTVEPLRGCRQSVRLGLIKCRDEQKCARIGIEISEPRGEGSLEACRQRKCLESGRRFELEAACRDRELGQGQRVPCCFFEDADFEIFGQVRSSDIEQGTRRVIVQSPDRKLGEPSVIDFAPHAVTNRDEKYRRLQLQTPRNECQRFGGGTVEPVGIVNREQNRRVRRQLRDQPESGKTDQEDIRRATGKGKSESHLQRIPLWRGQLGHEAQRWKQELVQSSERELCLRLNPVRAEHCQTERVRPFRCRCEERRLADSRFATDDERSTMIWELLDDPIEPSQLVVPSEQ